MINIAWTSSNLFRYYRKLRDSSSPSVSLRLHQPPDIVAGPSSSLANPTVTSPPTQKSTVQSTPRRILDQSKRFLLSARKGSKPTDRIDYVPVAKGDF